VTNTSKPDSRIWAVVPAAGVGRRMGSHVPKQYLNLAGKPVIQHTLERLLGAGVFTGLVIALGEEDEYWHDLPSVLRARCRTVVGGAERSDSVCNALAELIQHEDAGDWVMVHDVARPCIHAESLQKLIATVTAHPVGGILAVPATDTLKQVTGQTIHTTIDRSRIWQAQTPQMFRLGTLHDALQQAAAKGYPVTDEASAMEALGLQPCVVEGRRDNLKITMPEDIALAEYFLAQQPVMSAQ